jgi:tetratricopeptide (TPR) repeat protein
LRRSAGDARVDLASGSDAASDAVEGLAEVSPQAKIAAAILGVLKSLLPDRDWAVTGELQAAGEQGEGLSLAIANSGAFVDFGEFWAASVGGPGDPDGVEAYRRLTVPAAGWLAHHVAMANRSRDVLTTDAISWGLTQCGLFWYDRGNRDAAREFYERALGRDGDNIAALTNLGAMDSEEGDYETGAERLARALRLLESR